MKALITGASSGIGRDIAAELSKRGFDLVLVARRTNRLEELKNTLDTEVTVISADLSNAENCIKLYEQCGDIDILVNNAGFGVFGEFDETDLGRELEMIDVNIKAVHILTKLFLRDFKVKNSGRILNVASSAAFFPGPVFSSYYASKAYVYRLSEAIYRELRHDKSKVSISVLCPGPVSTEFGDVADVHFSAPGLTSKYVAEYAVKKMLAGKHVIVPGFLMKFTRVLSKLLPDRFSSVFVWYIQKKKCG